MKIQTFIGKTEEEALEKAKETLNATEDELFIGMKRSKKKLLGTKIEIEAITKYELNQEIKSYLQNITKLMGIDVKIEMKKRENMPLFNLLAQDASVLIGKNGKTIEALQTITHQMVNSQVGEYYKFQLDVNDYKNKKRIKLERQIKQIAKEVARTKVEAHLEPMNAYERRLVHNALTNWTNVETHSEEEGPKRHVVITPKEEE
ncbi:MAG: RNA-binding cell elongation regulator Jag/EloR [bacterium]|nr:RNA-binding cell elongation regulator Jag/EloR [bacterium]